VSSSDLAQTKSSRHQIAALEALEEVFSMESMVTRRKMFGLPGFSTGGKFFACVLEDGIALKLPKDRIAGLADPAISQFEAGGRPMNGWVHIRRQSADEYLRDRPLFDESLAYVASIAASSSGA
jgi:hypothetical protein